MKIRKRQRVILEEIQNNNSSSINPAKEQPQDSSRLNNSSEKPATFRKFNRSSLSGISPDKTI